MSPAEYFTAQLLAIRAQAASTIALVDALLPQVQQAGQGNDGGRTKESWMRQDEAERGANDEQRQA